MQGITTLKNSYAMLCKASQPPCNAMQHSLKDIDYDWFNHYAMLCNATQPQTIAMQCNAMQTQPQGYEL
jgi:hypothetical protein